MSFLGTLESRTSTVNKFINLIAHHTTGYEALTLNAADRKVIDRLSKHTAQNHTKIAVIANDVGHIKEAIGKIEKSVGSLNKNFDEKFVTKTEFEPVKKGFFGLVGAIGIAIIGAIVSVIIGLFTKN